METQHLGLHQGPEGGGRSLAAPGVGVELWPQDSTRATPPGSPVLGVGWGVGSPPDPASVRSFLRV